MSMSWTCDQCGAVWAPWFPGPCPHPGSTVSSATTSETALDDRVQGHTHKYGDQDMTIGSVCLICGNERPPLLLDESTDRPS